MPTPKQMNKMSVSEIETLKEQTSDFEEIIHSDEGQVESRDQSSIREQLRKNKLILQRDQELVARGSKKDAIIREIKQIEDQIARERPTRAMMSLRPGDDDFNKAVRLNVEFQKKFGPLMARLKDLKRRLEPDDPEAGNLERIRQ